MSVNPSKDPEKTQKSISNIFPYSTLKLKIIQFRRIKRSTSLEKIYEVVHQNNLKKPIEEIFKKSKKWLNLVYLNKQAAFVEKITICEEAEESPLGPIKVMLTSSRIDEIIDWFVYGDEN